MSFTLGPTARGGLAARWSGLQLTSAYDPGREARAWAEGLRLEPGTVVFVAGDPWGLASEALNDRGCRGVALLPGAAAEPYLPAGVRSWCPDRGALEPFLEEVWDDWGPDAVRWETWPAFERLAPEVSLDWSRRFRDAFRTYQGSWLSLRHFGRRTWSNAVRNAVGWERPVTLRPGTRPIVIAASGPSLEDGWKVLEHHRDRFDLWALPSSFESLVRRGLMPDAGVATDGGWYAREHLHRLAGTPVPLAAALSAAADPQLSCRDVLFFGQGHPFEKALLEALPAPAPVVPSQGTVAVTALRLALAATEGPVYIAGLDLAHRGLRAHAAPHTVDRRAEAVHDRLMPLESWWAGRTLDHAPVFHEGVRTSSAMLTYAGWLRTGWSPDPRVVRIAPTAVRWPTMAEASWEEAAHRWRTGTPGRPSRWVSLDDWPGRERRTTLVRQALEALASRAEAAAGTEAWIGAAARTAVPEAVAEGWSRRRSGGDGPALGAEVGRFVRQLIQEALG